MFEQEPEGRGHDPAQARHLHLGRRRAAGLRPHDRVRDAAPRSGSRAAGATCSHPRALPEKLATPAEVAPILRGMAAAVEDANDGSYKRWILEFRTSADDPELRQRRRRRALLAGRRRDARPRHPHQGEAADRCRRRRPARSTHSRAAARAALEAYFADVQGVFRAQQRAHRRAAKKTMLDPMPRVMLVPGLGLFALGAAAKDARDRRRRLAEMRSRRSPRRRRSALTSRSPKPTCSTSSTGRWSRRSSARSREAAGAPGGAGHRRRLRHRRRHRRGVRGARAPRSWCSTATSAAAEAVAKKLGGVGIALPT